MTTLHATRGANYWSRRPVTRLDLLVGAYEDISSADVPGVAEALARSLPGLVEHRCSIGERGGFLLRLRRGTYVPHIVEHVALELQTMMGHDVGYGRTRGGDVPGEYTLVFEHMHEQVGLRAAALGLETVQRAFAGTLDGSRFVDAAVAELAAIARTPDTPPIEHHVRCAVSGGSGRAECVRLLSALGSRQPTAERRAPSAESERPLAIDVSPAFLLQAGLPFATCDVAIVLDTAIADVPERYREHDRAGRLLGVLADGVGRDGYFVCPAKEWEMQDYARDDRLRVAVFATDDDVTRRDLKVASAVALVRDGRIVLEHCGDPEDGGPLRDDLPANAQVAAALAAYVLRGCGD